MRSRMQLIPIVSTKKQRNEDITYAGLGANNIYNLYAGVGVGDVETTSTVQMGKKVFSVDVSVNFASGSGVTSATWAWMLLKLRAGQSIVGEFAAVNAAFWSNIGLSNARNQIIKSFMGIVTSEDGVPLRANLHIPIPRLMQRVREGDQLLLVFNADVAGPLSIGSRYKSYQ